MKEMTRASGILLAVSSLPSPYGIGTLGRAAYRFADFLKASGQTYWQMLPLGPTSYGDSPYQSFSTFAGNPYYIDLDFLVEDGLLTQAEIDAVDWGEESYVNYETLYNNRFRILALAKERGYERDRKAVEAFVGEMSEWIEDYALFMACKKKFGMVEWLAWPDEALKRRDPKVLFAYREELKEDVEFYIYLQFLFYRQWTELKAYLNRLGIQTIGDLPIYVALDSSDVWREPECFQLDADGYPTAVAGVPPDYFCEDGQLWGNPLYDWAYMKQTGYNWWIRRIGSISGMFDVIRLDHFRGLSEYWAVPYKDKTAKGGRWVEGPGMDLVGVLNGWFCDTKFIAEDLGAATPGLYKLLSDSGWPGMKVLEFAFDSKEESDYLPHMYDRHCVCYTGTHDNAPLSEWFSDPQTAPEDIEKARVYLNLTEEEGFCMGMIRGGMSSVADLFVMQMQDCLELGKEARMNRPGTLGGNWQWRLLKDQLTEALSGKLLAMTKLYGRVEEQVL